MMIHICHLTMENSVTVSNIRMDANDYILELSRPLVKSAYQK